MQRLCTGALFCLLVPFATGCPVPDISVPDFTPVPPAADAAGGDQAKGGDGGNTMMTWRTEKTPTTSALRAVWVADAALSQSYAVGVGGTILSRSAAGVWTAETSTTQENLSAVTALGPDDVYAAGGQAKGVILHRKAGVWKAEAADLMLGAIYGMAVVGTDLFAVGDNGTVAHLSGGSWTLETTPMQANFHGVYGKTVTDVYAVGEQGGIVHRDGTGTWSVDTATLSPADGMGTYYGIAALADVIFISGSQGRVLRRDTGKWTPDFTMDLIKADMAGAPADLLALIAADGEMLTVGTGGVVAHRDSKGAWTRESSGVGTDLFGLGGAGIHAVLAVGDMGVVVRRN